MKMNLSILALFLFANISMAQRQDKELQKEIESLVQGFNGKVGIYVLNLKTGKVAAFNADSIFPTASMVKIPILIGVMDKISKGELKYHDEIVYKDSLLYSGVDILGSFKSDEKIELSKVMMLMLTMSDNTASLWLQSLAGNGLRINQILDSLGFKITRVNSRTPGREEARNEYGWGQSSPREMVELMRKIYKGEIIDRNYSARMLRLLGRNYWDEAGISQVPPDIFVASKNGAVDESRSETMFVAAPHEPYIFSIMTNNNKDQSWQPGNEAWVLTRKLSQLLWNKFEPKLSWQPFITVEGN
ncbi:MAG: serine hydrolase [Bacteroidetes bacterium]|nr:MAG: serine hydrolase [Bacteroidota bacterium]